MEVIRPMILLVVFCYSALVSAQYVDNKSFPIKSPIFATVTVALLTEKRGGQWAEFEFQKKRDNVLFYEGRGDFSSIFYKQPIPAPIIYVIPGVGGGEDSGTSNWLAEKLFEKGYNVATLPSPFSWGFSLRGSTSGIVGFLPDDTKDLYKAIVQLEKELTKTHGMVITNRGLVGYSLGGLTISHLVKWDRKFRQLNFSKSLMINPPVDLKYGVDVLDKQYQTGMSWKPSERQRVKNRAFELLKELYIKPIDELVNEGVEQKIDLTDDELKYLIGESFRGSLGGVVFATQQVNDLGVLKTKASHGTRAARAAEARTFDFMSYVTKFVYKFLVSQGEKRVFDKVIAEVGLLGNKKLLQTDSSIFLMHNEDDFLLRPGDAKLLMKMMPGRARIYKHGGHVGNIWHSDNLAYIEKVFSSMCGTCYPTM